MKHLAVLSGSGSGERRAGMRAPCSVWFCGGAARTALSGRITELSTTGLRMSTNRSLPVGSTVHLDLELSDGPFDVVGEVRRVRESPSGVEMGVRFVRFDADCARALSSTLRKPMPRRPRRSLQA